MKGWIAVAAMVFASLTWGAQAQAREACCIPVMRLSMGSAIDVTPSATITPRFALDLTGGLIWGEGVLGESGSIFGGEMGYSYEYEGTHLFSAAATAGWGTPGFGVMYRPRFLVGAADGEAAIGMRNAVVFNTVYDLLNLEVGHRFLSQPGPMQHRVDVMLGLNAGTLVYAAFKFMGAMVTK